MPLKAWIAGEPVLHDDLNGNFNYVTNAIAAVPPGTNVAAYGALGDGATDCTAAFNAAFAASSGVVDVPAGSWVLLTPLAWTGRSITLRGAGKGATTIYIRHSGVGLTIAQASLFYTVNIIGITFRASTTVASAAALDISWPDAASFPNATATITDCEFDGTTAGSTTGYPSTFTDGVRVTGGWQVHFTRCSGYGALVIAGASALTGTSLIKLAKCFGATVSDCKAISYDAFVRQSDYCEGIAFISSDSVGCNTNLKQDAGITARAGFILLGLWATNCEINNYLSGFDVRLTRVGQMAANHFARFGDSGATGYICLRYTDCDTMAHSANVLGGGGADTPVFSTAKAIVLAGTTNGIVFDSSNAIVNCAVGATLAAGTYYNLIRDVQPKDVAPLSTFTDAGTNNRVTWLTVTGRVGTGGALLDIGPGGAGFWAHAYPGAQPARAVTLADVIAVLANYGLTA